MPVIGVSALSRVGECRRLTLRDFKSIGRGHEEALRSTGKKILTITAMALCLDCCSSGKGVAYRATLAAAMSEVIHIRAALFVVINGPFAIHECREAFLRIFRVIHCIDERIE